jgi:hypothetical protein
MPLVWQNQFLIKMKKTISIIIIALILGSCSIFGSLHSTTSIKPNDSFVLGNNEHGSFKVVLKNISNHDLRLVMAPVSGGTHSPLIVTPNETVKVKTDKNTALIIENKSTEPANVALKVTGDIGLSMGYKN